MARFLSTTPRTQTNRQVGFELEEKVPTRDGKNEVRTSGKTGMSVPTCSPGVMSSNSAPSPSAKCRTRTEDGGWDNEGNIFQFCREHGSFSGCARFVCTHVHKT